MDRFNVDRLADDWPFEIDRQAGHLFKHPYLGLDDVSDVWTSDPLFYPAKPPAHWLMVAEVSGQVLMAPLATSNTGDRASAVPSVATSQPTISPAATGRTDEEENDPRTGKRLLR